MRSILAQAANAAEQAGETNASANQSDTAADTATTFNAFIESLTVDWRLWLTALGFAAGAAILALILHAILISILARLAKKTPWHIDNIAVDKLRAPTGILLPILAAQLALTSFTAQLPATAIQFVLHMISIVLIIGLTWLLVRLTTVGQDTLFQSHNLAEANNLRARRLHTQLSIIKRTIVFFILVIGVAAILMTFPRVRQFGASLLASAGVAGLIIGLAARPTVENLISGLQIALTQPIRLDDVVIINGEWGRIEEITSTYVVLKIWDERRLIIPFSRIISEPFENWTRSSSQILGTIFLHTDYTVPVDDVRKQLKQIVEPNENWDGRVCGLLVTDTTERTMTLRALISAADASKAWDLRCHVREKLIDWLQREHPGALPKQRADLCSPLVLNEPQSDANTDA